MCPLQQQYLNDIVPAMMTSQGYANRMQVPRLSKIVISTGVGSARERDAFEETTRTLAEITGQRPVLTKARVSVANFKLRQGMNVGVCVTLRSNRMYDFFYRLVHIALPRVRDFRGIPTKSFDGFGNYTLGITDQTIFTEVNLDKMKHTVGMNVTIVTTAKTDEEGRELLTLLGAPFAK